ncbi:MAG: HPr family phosphocarrier protein [Candidatus Omnitrophota bacterium]
MDKTYLTAYDDAVALLKNLIADKEHNSIGFFASSARKDNYKRLFARDAFWICMADILTEEDMLIQGCRDSFGTLSKYQREDGAIPSNVSPEGKVSYGIINPRIDPTTLYIIGFTRFAKRHPQEGIVDKYFESIKRAVAYLENNWENKEYEFLYIPRAGNWADEYLQQGFVLYDEVLWYIALSEYADMLKMKGCKRQDIYRKKAERIKKNIRERFWIGNIDYTRETIYSKISEKFDFNSAGYFLHFYFSPRPEAASFQHPVGIFDAFGNILAMLADIPTEEQVDKIVNFIDEISQNKYPLVPAHYPFFPEETFKSQKIHQYRFKEFVGHFHNGGLWAWYTGAYVAALVKAGREMKALKFLNGIIKANNEIKDGMNFYEYHTGARAKVDLEIVNSQGIDLYLSARIAELAKKARSMVLVHYGKDPVDASSDMSLRALKIKSGDRIKITAVGPDSQEIVKKIAELKEYDSTPFFKYEKLSIKNSRPGGAPYLGVSAAAYIIAYKAFFEKKILFEDVLTK